MKIETAEQYRQAAERWQSLERTLNDDRLGPMSRRNDEGRQIDLERAMQASPFEFDEDGNVVLKTKNTPVVNDRIRML